MTEYARHKDLKELTAMAMNDPLGLMLRVLGIQAEKEYRFHHKRRWRFDYALPDKMIALEYEGGIWGKGRHVRGKGYAADCEKYNESQAHGWKVFRYTSESFKPDKINGTMERLKEICGIK